MLAAGSGCQSVLTHFIVSAPNRFHPLRGQVNLKHVSNRLHGVDQQFWVIVGPPEARLLVSVMEPKNGAMCPRGTVLVVHGIYSSSSSMMGKARDLASAGYRAVLVDVRGHGQSSGEFLTFGLRESQDLSQVIDALAARGLWAGNLGVVGISYGATTSIHLAGRDPRVAAVVAIAPFNNMRQEVSHFAYATIPFSRKLMADETVQQAINRAGQIARYDPDLASADLAISQTSAPILLMHGDEDGLVPSENSAQLAWAGSGNVSFVQMPGLGHHGIWFDREGDVKRLTRQWFDLYLGF